MDVVKDLETVGPSYRGSAIAIGNFDGVHRGHQAVLGNAIAWGVDHQVPVGAMTFEPHPREFFQPARPVFRLSPPDRKLELLAAIGIDFTALLTFDADLANLEAEDFVARVLVGGFDVRHVAVGYDFFFGKRRGGNPEVMRQLGAKHGFSVSIVSAAGAAGDVYSSSRIRELLQEGDPHGAAQMLGYWWRVKGTVTGGAQRGTWLGFPTANITLDSNQEFCHGIYAVRIAVESEVYGGAAYLGTRPTFDDGAAVLEVFLFDFDRDIYGKTIEVELIDFLRHDVRFKDETELKAQMLTDCEAARQKLADLASGDPMQAYPLGKASGI